MDVLGLGDALQDIDDITDGLAVHAEVVGGLVQVLLDLESLLEVLLLLGSGLFDLFLQYLLHCLPLLSSLLMLLLHFACLAQMGTNLVFDLVDFLLAVAAPTILIWVEAVVRRRVLGDLLVDLPLYPSGDRPLVVRTCGRALQVSLALYAVRLWAVLVGHVVLVRLHGQLRVPDGQAVILRLLRVAGLLLLSMSTSCFLLADDALLVVLIVFFLLFLLFVGARDIFVLVALSAEGLVEVGEVLLVGVLIFVLSAGPETLIERESVCVPLLVGVALELLG